MVKENFTSGRKAKVNEEEPVLERELPWVTVAAEELTQGHNTVRGS